MVYYYIYSEMIKGFSNNSSERMFNLPRKYFAYSIHNIPKNILTNICFFYLLMFHASFYVENINENGTNFLKNKFNVKHFSSMFYSKHIFDIIVYSKRKLQTASVEFDL